MTPPEPPTLADRIAALKKHTFSFHSNTNRFLLLDEALPIIEAQAARIATLEAENERIRTLRVDLKPEGQRTKPEEWEACYAALFNRMNPLNEERYQLKARIAELESLDIDAFLIRLGMPHVKTCFPGDGNPTVEQMAREIGKALIQIHLGLCEPISDEEIDGHIESFDINTIGKKKE